MRKKWRKYGGWWALLILTACHKENVRAPALEQNFVVHGVVQALEPDGKTVVIQHEAISNYMGAMTMPFEARNSNELHGLRPGDAISFHLIVTSKEGWIEGITLRQKSAVAVSAAPVPRAATLLAEGDMLPDYHFTNELGEAVSLSQYKGELLAFTFFFTSCPFPNFCPRLTGNFAEAAAQLRQMSQWHLLSISFDPTNDTPARLLTYAQNAGYHPAEWSFLTGDPAQIRGLADQVGENFWKENGSISHNLRTVVVDPSGRLRKIFQGNGWTSADLTQEMIKVHTAWVERQNFK